MARRVATRRIVLTVLAVPLLAVTGCLLHTSSVIKRRFEESKVARPGEMRVDLSRPGTYAAPFVHKYASAHGLGIHADLPAPPAGKRSTDLLDGLQGTVTFTDKSGGAVFSAELSDQLERDPYGWGSTQGHPAYLADCSNLPRGEYVMRVTVTRGAPALEGTAPTIFGLYHLCGCEAIPALYLGFWAFILALPTAIVTLMLLFDLLIAIFPALDRQPPADNSDAPGGGAQEGA
jgi:hypothetical protein